MSEPYTPQSQLLARLLAEQSQTPVRSVGQGLANLGGVLGTAYFEKQNDKKQAAALAQLLSGPLNPGAAQDAQGNAGTVNAGMFTAANQPQAGQADPQNPGFTNAQVSLPADMAGAQQVPQAQRLAQLAQMIKTNPQMASQIGPAMQLAQAFTPKTEFRELGANGGAIIDAQGNVIKTLPGKPQADKVESIFDPKTGQEQKVILHADGTYTPIGGQKAEKAESDETFGEPQTVTGPDGQQKLVRFGNRGSMMPVQGFAPKDNADLNLPKRQPGQSDDEYLSDLSAADPGAAAMVKQIANYEQPLPSSRSGKVNPIATAALALNPNLDNRLFKARNTTINDFTNGKMADQKQYLDRVTSNLGTWYDSVKDLQNHGGVAALLNAPENAVTGIWSGKVSSARQAADTFATEARNVFAKGSSGGNLEEFKTWQNNVSPNQSPEQTETTKNTFLKNFDAQLNAMADRWNTIMPNKRSKASFLSDETLGVLQRVAPDYYTKLTGSQAPAATNPNAITPSAGMSPQPQQVPAAPAAQDIVNELRRRGVVK